LKRLLTALGVDYGQWMALTRTAIRNDLRASSVAGERSRGRSRGTRFLVIQTAFYTAMGLLVAVLVWPIRDVFLSGMIVVSYVMFMVGMAALLDHNAVIVSPDDYGILGFRPLDSRTYFAAKMTNVLVYTLAMTTLFALLPLAGFFLRWGSAVGVASVAAVYGASVLTALVMILAYAALLRALGPRRLKTGLSYLQMIFSFAVYGGYFAMARLADADSRAAFHIDKSVGLLFAPPTWFASYFDLASGRGGLMVVVPALASLVSLLLVGLALGGRMSLDYSQRLGALTAVGDSRSSTPRRRRPVPFFTRGEARAVSLLVRSQFRDDTKFRMGVLAILPLTVVYLVIGIGRWGGHDPFESGKFIPNLSLITIAMLIFPTLLKMNLARSDSFRASWIFFASPADRTRLVRAAQNVLTLMFLFPYLVLVGGVLTYFSRRPGRALVYVLVVGLISRLILQVAMLLEPELPFSKPVQKGSAFSRIVFLMVSVGLASAVFPSIGELMFRSPPRAGAVVAILLLAGWGADRALSARMDRQAARLEFEGS
jgi:hypothetical protein